MENEEHEFKEQHLIFDSNRGIYIPKNFAEIVNPDWVKDFEKFKDYLEDLNNPEQENYWDSWQYILDNMQIELFGNGIYYNLHQDGDLWAVIY